MAHRKKIVKPYNQSQIEKVVIVPQFDGGVLYFGWEVDGELIPMAHHQALEMMRDGVLFSVSLEGSVHDVPDTTFESDPTTLKMV